MSEPRRFRFKLGDIVTFIHPDHGSIAEGTITELTVNYTPKLVTILWVIEPHGMDDARSIPVLDSSVLATVRLPLKFIPCTKRPSIEGKEVSHA